MQTLYGVVFDLTGTLTYLTRPEAELIQAGAIRAVDYLIAQGMSLPREEFTEKFIAARAFARHKSELEQEEHLATDTLAFLLQFYGYPKADRRLIRQAVDLAFAPEVEAHALYADARDTLEALRARGIRLGVLANAQDDRAVQRIVRRLGLDALIDLVVTSAGTEDRHRKPRPDAWALLWQAWDLLPYEMVMVGDDLVEDILGALNAQMWTIWVRRGAAGSELEQAIRPDATVTALAETPAVLQRWEEG